MKTIKLTFIKALFSMLALLLSSLSFSHHSTSEFSTLRGEMEGRLIQLSWRSPHPGLTFQSASTGALWHVQLPGTIRSLAENGITESSFEIGQTFKVAGLESSRTQNSLQATQLIFADGNAFMLKPDSQSLGAHNLEIVSDAAIADNVMISDLSNYISLSNKLYLLFSAFIALLAAYALLAFRNKPLQIQ